jgi:hypothetical protein
MLLQTHAPLLVIVRPQRIVGARRPLVPIAILRKLLKTMKNLNGLSHIPQNKIMVSNMD